MKDINLFTNRPITFEECYTLLKANLKYVNKNGDDEIMIGNKFPVFLEITDDTLLTYEIPFEKEFIDQIKLTGDPYMTGFRYHRIIDAKRIIEILLTAYPELFIHVDDETPWFGTGSEYLKDF